MPPKIELKEELCDVVEAADFTEDNQWPPAVPLGRFEQLMALINIISVAILKFSSKVCQVDLFDGHKSEKKRPIDCGRVSRAGSEEVKTKEALGGWSRKETSCILVHWPKIIYVITLYCMSKMIINIYFQYQYDRDLLRLRRALQGAEFGISIDVKAMKMQLETSRQRLKSIGAPHINGTIAIECTYITIILLCLIAYVLAHLYFRHIERYDFYLLRSILNRHDEQRRRNALILEEINKFIESRRNFTNNCLDSCLIIREACPHQAERLTAARKLVHRLTLDHQLMVRQFKLMANCGALVPLNRTDSWIDWMSLVFCVFCCSCYAWSILFNAVFYTMLSRIAHFEVEWEPLDLLFTLDLMIMSTVITLGLTFYLSTCIVSCIDQARLISQVRALVLNCIKINTRIYFATKRVSCANSGRRASRKRHELDVGSLETSTDAFDLCSHYSCDELNANLLHTIMHYKTFVVQLKPVLKPVGFVSMVSICIMLVHPLMVRLHTPYVESVELKSRYYIISLITAFFVNCIILPVCYINSRCVDLYNALFSLLAHTIELTSLNETRNQSDLSGIQDLLNKKSSRLVQMVIYDNHSMWSLRRELEASQRFVGQFETRSLGITFTYSNLLRIYFWLSAILLSIFVEPSEHLDSSSLFTTFLRDPLGFYDF